MKDRTKILISVILLTGLCVFSRYDEEIMNLIHQTMNYIGLSADYTNEDKEREVAYIQVSGNICSDNTVIEVSSNQNEIKEVEPLISVILTNESGTYMHQTFHMEADSSIYINQSENISENEIVSMNQIDEKVLSSYFDSCSNSFLYLGTITDHGWDYQGKIALTINNECSIYQGIFRIEKVNEGYQIVNILPLELYLSYVVPSEMPSDFPMEALKTQAICARTYAYQYLEGDQLSEYHANVDDTTAYQVYHTSASSNEANEAITETRGIIITYQGSPITSYYYSCSCGHSTTPDIWRSNKGKTFPYLNYKQYDELEANLPWYRWTFSVNTLDSSDFYMRIIERAKAQPEIVTMIRKSDGKEVSNIMGAVTALVNNASILNMEITERKSGEVADCLTVETKEYFINIYGEFAIRTVLGSDKAVLIRQDGSIVEQAMVPSGFFTMNVYSENNVVCGYFLEGGGYGHGVGMSQYGARELALQGSDYESILTYYYQDVTIDAKY